MLKIVLFNIIAIRSVFSDDYLNLIMTDIGKMYIDAIQLSLSQLNKSNTISNQCSNSIYNITTTKDSKIILQNTLFFVSGTPNDLTTEKFCSKNHFSQLTYLILRVHLPKNFYGKNSLTHEFQSSNFYGICFVKGCSNQEYTNFFYNLGQNNHLFKYLKVNKTKDLTITNVEVVNNYFYEGFFEVRFIPYLIILIFILFALFPSIPAFVFKCCFRKNKKKDKSSFQSEENQIIKSSLLIENEESSLYEISKLDQFKNFFVFSKNQDELYNHKTNYNDDTGLSVIRGINSIFLIFYAVAVIYAIYISSPLKQYCAMEHLQLIKSWTYSIIFVGTRISPRIIFATSGFVLSYKLINYLEDKKVYPTDINDIPTSESTISFPKPCLNQINIKLYCKFILSHLYIYLVYVFYLSFVCFSFFYIIGLFYHHSPIWAYFNQYVLNFDGIIVKFIEFAFLVNVFYEYSQFWVIQNIFIYFIFFSAVIFIFFRYKLRLDILLIFVTVANTIGKLLIYITLLHNINFFPTLIGGNKKKDFIIQTPLFNSSSYAIGCFFGLVNYVFQNSITLKQIVESELNFLRIPLHLVNFFNTKWYLRMILITFIGLSFMVFDSFSLCFLTDYIINENYDYMNPKGIFLFYLIDVDLFIIFLLLILTGLTICQATIIYNIFCLKIWIVMNRIKYNFIILTVIVSYFIIYNIEDRVEVAFYIICIFSIYTLVISLMLSFFMYLIMEVPLKKIFKCFFESQQKNIDIDFKLGDI